MLARRFASYVSACGEKTVEAAHEAGAFGGVVVAALALSVIATISRCGISLETVRFALLLAVLAVASLHDLAWRVIPNWCVGVALVNWFAFAVTGFAMGAESLAHACELLVGAFVVSGVLLGVSLVADRGFGGESLGGGDLKLLFAVSLYFGWEPGVAIVVASCLMGALFSAIAAIWRGEWAHAFALGPWIALACAAIGTVSFF